MLAGVSSIFFVSVSSNVNIMFQKSAFLGIAMWNSSRQRVDKKSAAKLSEIFEVKSEFVGNLATSLEFSARP